MRVEDPPPQFARGCRLLRNVPVPMRDGVTLATTIYLPESPGCYPVVLVRTAYNRVGAGGADWAQRGLAYAVQDVRGRYASGGTWYPFVHEQADGEDTLTWLAAQPWCNGRVGMFGDSYLAATQFYAALSGHPALVAANPRFMAGDCWQRAYYNGGAFSLGLTWSWLCFECAAPTSEAGLMPLLDVAGLLRSLPVAELDLRSGAGVVPWYRDYATSHQYGPVWETTNVRRQFARVRTPMLLVGGWYDYYAGETFRNWQALRESAPTDELREAHRVIVGPWTHGFGGPVLGEVDFGAQATAEHDCTQRWLSGLLGGGTPDEFQTAPIRLFQMGANAWRDHDTWPPAGTRFVDWHLRAAGRLDTAPAGDEAPDQFDYDPADPVPTRGGNHSIGPYNPGLYELAPPGPYDQRVIEARPDVLTYTSASLTADLDVTGPVRLTLFLSSSAPDTDIVARLCEVFADGRSLNLTEGVLRTRFRHGLWQPPRLMTPGEVVELSIDLDVTSNLFRAGHCLRLDVTSSCFPLLDRNLNTGGDPAWDTHPQVARQTVYHDARRASRLHLPVQPT